MKISQPRRSEHEECEPIERDDSDNESESDHYESDHVQAKLDEFSRIPFLHAAAKNNAHAANMNGKSMKPEIDEQDENSGDQDDGPLNLSKPRRQDRFGAGREKDHASR